MRIGLYVCEQIIKQHGGTLWVESESGKGITFSFTFPFAEAANTPELKTNEKVHTNLR